MAGVAGEAGGGEAGPGVAPGAAPGADAQPGTETCSFQVPPAGEVWRRLMRNVVEYVFPHGDMHPAAGERLYLWALHGPAVADPEASAEGGRRALSLAGGAESRFRPMLAHEERLQLEQARLRFLHAGRNAKITEHGRWLSEGELHVLLEQRERDVDEGLSYTPRELEGLLLRCWKRHRHDKGLVTLRLRPAVSETSLGAVEPAPPPPPESPVGSRGRLAPLSSREGRGGGGQRRTGAGRRREAEPEPPPSSVPPDLPKVDVSAAMAVYTGKGRRLGDPIQRAASLEKERIFALLSMAILDERERRLKVLACTQPRMEDVRRDRFLFSGRQRRLARIHPRPYLISTWDTPLDIQRGLHRHLYSLCDLGDKSGVRSVRCNMALLRPDRPIQPGHHVLPDRCGARIKCANTEV